MKSAASVKGHPVHPMLIVFPIAFWVGSFVLDLLYLWLEDPWLYRMSWYLIGGGIVGALAAAVPGSVDYFKSITPFSSCRTVARKHALVNLSVTALYGFNLWWRSGERAAAGAEWWLAFALAAAGIAGVSFGGWLGGDLVYKCEIGLQQFQVNKQRTIYGPALRAREGEFVEVARQEDLGVGQMKHVTVNGAWVALARTEEGFFAIDEICTHVGGPLCDGVLMGSTVQCPWHGSRFDVRTGEVRAGPAAHPIGTFEVRLEAGRVLVRAPSGPGVAAKARIG